MMERHQIGEYCWSDDDGACVRDRLLGKLLDDSVIGGYNKNIVAPDSDTSDEDGTAAHDDLHK